jgi:TonB family protein
MVVGTLLSSDLEWAAPFTEPEQRRWSLSLVVSAVFHGVVLMALCWRVAPIFVRPMLVARGSSGSSTPVSITLYFSKDSLAAAEPQPSILSFPAPVRKQSEKSRPRKRLNVLNREQETDSPETGSPFGSVLDGSSEGDDIRPGFAVTFTDPRVSRWELPSGLQGDVIVELSIDEHGNVVEEKLLQGLAHGVDEKVIATLRDWHFRPATRNGVAIPFKYDAHFHFPS